MKKKLILFVSLTCSLSVLATSALADNDAKCSDTKLASQLQAKGSKRLEQADEIFNKIDPNEQVDPSQKGLSASLAEKLSKAPASKDQKDVQEAQQKLKDKADCLVIIPSEKKIDPLLIIPSTFEAKYGRGVEYCKGSDGKYDTKNPSFVQLEGGGVLGWNWGAEESDLVIAVNKNTSKDQTVELAAGASASFYKWGRDGDIGGEASKNSGITAAYSSSKGFYLGADLFNAAYIAPDKEMNAVVMEGKSMPKQSLFEKIFHPNIRKQQDEACWDDAAPVANPSVNSNGSVLGASSAAPLGTPASSAIMGSSALSPQAPATSVATSGVDQTKPTTTGTTGTATTGTATTGTAVSGAPVSTSAGTLMTTPTVSGDDSLVGFDL